MDLRRDRLFLCLAHRCKPATTQHMILSVTIPKLPHRISLSFPHELDDIYHPHPVVPYRRRCKHLLISLLSSTYTSHPSPLQVIFGLLSDRFGRKWPLVANLLVVSVLSLGSGFVQTFQQFLAVRSLFGIGMGGIWGLASVTALENIPVEVRGVASGFMQQGYAVGYLIAAVVDLYLVPRTSWRALFWTASGISVFAAALGFLLPRNELFLRARRERQAELYKDKPLQSKKRIFLYEVEQMLKNHWPRCIYVVMLMSGFGFLSHGSRDLYPRGTHHTFVPNHQSPARYCRNHSLLFLLRHAQSPGMFHDMLLVVHCCRPPSSSLPHDRQLWPLPNRQEVPVA